MKKRFALIPAEQEKECPHECGAWSGSMPCTGIYRCYMCGLELVPYTQQPVINRHWAEQLLKECNLWPNAWHCRHCGCWNPRGDVRCYHCNRLIEPKENTNANGIEQ